MPLVAASDTSIADAGRVIREGGLVAFPTETVYGLGADATNGEAVAAIFAAKGRPSFNPLIVHVPDLAAAVALGVFSDEARALAVQFWPGPLTLVVKRRAGCPVADLATAGLDTVALRVPDHSVAQQVLRAAGRPLAAPSANWSGHVSPTLARHVDEDLGDRVAMILDGGATVHGVESTVVDASGDGLALLRPGSVTADDIARVLGHPIARGAAVADAPVSPGQLASHYAPKARLRLEAAAARDGEALLAFGRAAPSTGFVINLSPSGDLAEAAAHLFSALRAFDAAGSREVAVMPIPEAGLGVAINDRLCRAAAPRP
ncbi:MAG: threonylcarbamoyl-AMP synthase [Hyphomicrobium sp.]|nr:threonylcarbamoyl-AMP synthase [Hyphomicrobium sp.]PPD08936.1 MAG: threonylcarbamoyl-AMP synthase [Hyphomicrobium sp.]